ncbi:MAG: aminotransferase [Paenibacillaceae bacterium]|jgi:cysteine desulfurase|nr:aminotransferase [Paenibacillaceae bacterium]
MLYLDHCASTPPWPEVIAAVADCMGKFYGNPSSLHRLGVEAEGMLIKAREVTAAALQVKSSQIIFTSGGTESNNLAIKGAALTYRSRGRHLITSAIEHASVYEVFRQLEREGFQVTYLPVDRTGAVRAEDVAAAITRETILVSVMAVNNETGRIQPVAEVGAILRNYPRIVFHVDAVQALGKLPVHPRNWNADLVSFSAHKLRGPKGVGGLYCREGLHLEPLHAGGGQEQGRRSGTENLPLIVGAAKAIRMAVEQQKQAAMRMYGLREKLISRLNKIDGLIIHGSEQQQEMAPHMVQFSCPGYRPEVIIHRLEEKEIYISSGSACGSGENKPSRVLTAIGLPEQVASSGLRVSFSDQYSEADMELFADELAHVLTITPRLGELKQGGRTK